jgi:hypothetical protein
LADGFAVSAQKSSLRVTALAILPRSDWGGAARVCGHFVPEDWMPGKIKQAEPLTLAPKAAWLG